MTLGIALVVAAAVGCYLQLAYQDATHWAPLRRQSAEGFREVAREAEAVIERQGDREGRMARVIADCTEAAARSEREADRMWTWPFTERGAA